MARVLRLDGPGACHHVIVRGVERRPIFLDDLDRRDFVARLRKQLIEGSGSCLAWVLMDNHVHLVLRTGSRPLSSVMRRLNGGYARAFNLRHQRCGYLFQDRFRSFLVEDEAYLLVLIRYVHLNPLRSGVVRSLEALERYPWGGYAELLDASGSMLLATDEVLAHFGDTARAARRSLMAWMGVADAEQDVESDPIDARRATPEASVASATRAVAWEPSGILAPTLPEIRANRLRAAGWTMESLIEWVCARLCADLAGMRGGRRTLRESQARAVVAALATRELLLPFASVATATGVTSGAVCRAVERGARIAEEQGMRLGYPAE